MSAAATARRLAAGAAVLLLLGCAKKTPIAGAGPEEPPEPRRVTVIVENNPRRPTSLTVWVKPRYGGPKMLGTVLAEATESFTFVPEVPTGEYVLVARTAFGGELVSNPFPMSGTVLVRWSLFSNIATTTTLETP